LQCPTQVLDSESPKRSLLYIFQAPIGFVSFFPNKGSTNFVDSFDKPLRDFYYDQYINRDC
jgi:hypothetical protein